MRSRWFAVAVAAVRSRQDLRLVRVGHDHRADPVVGEQLEEDRVRDPSVEESRERCLA
jgi:hypothetical protein